MHAPEADYYRALAGRLDAAPHSGRGGLVQEAAAFLGVSVQQVYRRLHAAGWRSGRKLRTDKGDTRLTDDELQSIANVMVESARANGKRLLGVRDAMDILRANGKLAVDVAPETALRVMRARGLHPDQLARATPHTNLRSLHPNHCWQFDVSVCVLFYLDGAGLGVMDEKRFYKNKPENLKKVSNDRVLRYLITDHYTGAFYLHYYLARGENQETLFDFLVRAWSKREHTQDPMHGVPLQLLWDAGSANQSYLIKNLLDRLTVHQHVHTPGNPRGKGQVETTHNIVERSFEGRLSLMRVTDIDHLNAAAHTWMRWHNGTRLHSRHGSTRYGLWQTIRQEQLRLCPPRELCEQLLRTKPEPRKVQGNLVVRYAVKGYEPAFYSVAHIDGVRVGESVDVCVNPYRAPNVDIVLKAADGTEHVYECAPLGRDAAGFLVDAPVIGESHQTARDTDVDQYRKALAKQAYNASTQLEVDKARLEKRPAFGGDIDPISYLEAQTAAHYMPRRGTELNVPQRVHVELKPLTHVEACRLLVGKLGRRLTSEDNAAVRAWYPDGVPEDRLDTLAAQLRGETQNSNNAVVNGGRT